MILTDKHFGLHRRNEERAMGNPNKEQNGANKEQNWEKWTKMVLPFLKIPLGNLSLDQKEQNFLGTPNFIAKLRLCWSEIINFNVLFGILSIRKLVV